MSIKDFKSIPWRKGEYAVLSNGNIYKIKKVGNKFLWLYSEAHQVRFFASPRIIVRKMTKKGKEV